MTELREFVSLDVTTDAKREATHKMVPDVTTNPPEMAITFKYIASVKSRKGVSY